LSHNHVLNAAVSAWMYETATQGILITDRELRIIGWNHWLADQTGRSEKSVLGENLFDVFPEIVERELDDRYRLAVNGQVSLLSQRLHGYVLRIPTTIEFRQFTYMQQRVRISPLLQDRAVIGTLTLIDDVTERVAREIELQNQVEARSTLLVSEKAARKEAEEANRLKDEFLATISHELRTPLSAIIGWANLLRTGRLDEAGVARAIETIHRNAHAQTQLISDLLDVSRITSDKLLLTVGSVDLASVVDHALEAVERDADAKGIRVEMEMEAHFPAISGDADRLQQVIWNLLSNAIKFTPDGGLISIRLRRVDSIAEISIKDSGIGIAPAFVPHVFDRFRQANSGITRVHGGLGLGLAIVKQLTELHGGTVHVESEGEGRGATFVIRLPLAKPRPAQLVVLPGGNIPAAEAKRNLKGMKILVVDDEADARDYLRAVFEKYGSTVTTTASASQALESLEHERPDFLISDLGMPGEDGYSLIGKVRALSAERGGLTPAAALTAYARVEDRARVLRAGFQIHLTKPIEPDELVAAVASVVKIA
jgi:signal transduction histidine kinase/ActR/RegA family two-component response regulator